MERYEKYKNSNIAWLGEIPEHWQFSKANYISKIFVPQRNKPTLNTNYGIPWLTMEDMLASRITNTSLRVTDDASKKAGSKILKQGAVIASCVGNFGVCTINDIDVIINQQLQAFIPDYQKIIPEYLCEIVRISSFYFEMVATSATVLYVNQSGFANMPVLLPPLEEQKAIARYLDRKTTEIEQLIAQKEKLIELYEEEKTAIINKAVTKSMNPDVKLKSSGIDWLGDIPKHWQQVPFRWCCYITEGQVDPTDSQFRQLPLIAPNHIESQTGKLIQKETAEEQGAISGKYFYKSGTLLYSKIRPALVKACIADEDGLCSADMYPIITKNNLLPKFMLYQILSKGFTQLAILVSDRVAMPKLNRDTLSSFSILVPPLEEQKEIADYIETETARIDAKIAKTKKIIELQKEYRTALISEAVTGKIKVP